VSSVNQCEIVALQPPVVMLCVRIAHLFVAAQARLCAAVATQRALESQQPAPPPSSSAAVHSNAIVSSTSGGPIRAATMALGPFAAAGTGTGTGTGARNARNQGFPTASSSGLLASSSQHNARLSQQSVTAAASKLPGKAPAVQSTAGHSMSGAGGAGSQRSATRPAVTAKDKMKHNLGLGGGGGGGAVSSRTVAPPQRLSDPDPPSAMAAAFGGVVAAALASDQEPTRSM
jgi:hypothetical protein